MKAFSLPKKIGFIAGPLLCVLVLLLPVDLINPAIDKVIAVALWMIAWWITEAVSISITALIPLALFPLLGIGDIKSVASNYANPIVYLFFGGFVIALALENVQLHKRIALSILKITGTKANGIILGFMIATALMSMWISNTASTVVMLPIAVSVIQLLIDDSDGFTKNDRNFALSIMLGIAFSANIGGMATLIGTPPNSVMLGILNDEGIDISFFQWMKMGVPFAIVLLTIAFFCITRLFFPNRLGHIGGSGTIIQNEINKLGKMSRAEKIVLIIFLLTAIAWMLRSYLNGLLPNINLTDTTISMLAALLLFIVPVDFKKGRFPIQWKDTSRLPWGILVLFGGSLALASGLKDSGLIALIGNYISGQQDWSIWIVIAILIILMLFMTELMSNVALVTVLIPLVIGIAGGFNAPILTMVIPVTLASSCAFMLPMATPPNAIVFASGHVRVDQMARIGVVLNVIAVTLLFGLAYWVVPVLFG